MLELFIKGGSMMYGLLACSIIGVYIIVEKILTLYTNKIDVEATSRSIKRLIHAQGKEACAQKLQEEKLIASKVIAATIQLSDLPRDEIREGLREITNREFQKIERNLDLLHSLITLAPIFGLLGTILGLMNVFQVISGGGLGDTTLLAKGIAEALITTVTGLLIAAPLIVVYHILNQKVTHFIADLERMSYDILLFCKSGKPLK